MKLRFAIYSANLVVKAFKMSIGNISGLSATFTPQKITPLDGKNLYIITGEGLVGDDTIPMLVSHNIFRIIISISHKHSNIGSS